MKTVVLTGAAGSIGQAIHTRLKETYRVIGFDLVSSSEIIELDLEKNIPDNFVDTLGDQTKLYGLVNCAGITFQSEFPYDEEKLHKTFQINFFSAVRLTIMLAQIMKKNGVGSIVNFSSLGAHRGFSNNPAYQASKAALAQFSRSLAYDLGPDGIRCNNIVPGYIESNMTRLSYDDPIKRQSISNRTLVGRWGKPDDVAKAVIFLLGQESDYITGIDLPVDGGWLAKGL